MSTAVSDEVEDLRDKVAGLKAENKALVDENEGLRSEISSLQREVDDLDEKLNERDAEMKASFVDAVAGLRAECERQTGSLRIRVPDTDRASSAVLALFDVAGVKP
jgi:predicted nuclease with TOPRIM domain